MALHYPFLFLYGEDGWHLNIPLNGVVVQDANANLLKTMWKNLSIKENIIM
jgi:hypothetical protein